MKKLTEVRYRILRTAERDFEQEPVEERGRRKAAGFGKGNELCLRKLRKLQ